MNEKLKNGIIHKWMYDEGFNDAIDKVLYWIDEELKNYASDINTPRPQTRKAEREQKDFRLQYFALDIFKKQLIALFKMQVSVPEERE